MKFSLKLPDQDRCQDYPQNPILKAEIPIAILNHSFLSAITAATSRSDISFSLSTHFTSGPCLKLAYNPTTIATGSFSISLKSGIGLFGSPNRSPLVFTANLSLSPSIPNPIPTFSLHVKPQLGHFSLHKSTFSGDKSDLNLKTGTNSSSGSPADEVFEDGFMLEKKPVTWEELKLEPSSGFSRPNQPKTATAFSPDKPLAWRDGGKNGFLSGIKISARTVLPLMKRVFVNLRWGAHMPADLGAKLPYLTVSKIAIETVEDVECKKKKREGSLDDLELLKGLCFGMGRDLEVLEKENREMKQCLEEIKLGVSGKSKHRESGMVRKKSVPPAVERSNQFEWQTSKRNGGEVEKPVDLASNLESELQRAIKAASS